MKLLFWFSLFLVIYAYLIYPSWLFLRVRLYPRPVRPKPIFPTVSIVIAARNEGKCLKEKLHSLQRLDYPAGLMETIVVSDGSTDPNERDSRQFSGFPGALDSVISAPWKGGVAQSRDRR